MSKRPYGKESGQFGIYRTVEKPVRLVNTEAGEDWDTGEALVAASFLEDSGKTDLKTGILFPSGDVRDAVVKSGLNDGVAASYQNLAGLLASLAEQI